MLVGVNVVEFPKQCTIVVESCMMCDSSYAPCFNGLKSLNIIVPMSYISVSILIVLLKNRKKHPPFFIKNKSQVSLREAIQ